MSEPYENTIDYKTHECLLMKACMDTTEATLGTGTVRVTYRIVTSVVDALDETAVDALDDTLAELNTVK